MKRRYLSLIPFDEAVRILKDTFPSPGITECISLEQAVGRVTAEPVFAPFSVPEVNLAGMDGIAVRSADTKGASERNPLKIDEFTLVNTGHVIPQGCDAVVMIEDVWRDGPDCRIRKSAFPGQFIRPAGEDIREGDLIVPRGHVVRPFDIGAFATYGISSLKVISVSVGLIPVGDELIPAGARPRPGIVPESNTLFAREYFTGMGAACNRYPITRDTMQLISDMLDRALDENELIILFGGSSAGTKDYVEQVIASCGTLLFHGVGMKPGTPAMAGSCDGIPVIGVPGFPVAAACVIREFAGRLLEWWGLPPYPTFPTRAHLATRIHSELGYEEFVQVSAARIGDRISVMPHSRGNGVQMSIVRSNGFVRIPSSYEGYEAGDEIQVHLTVPPMHVDNSLLICGIRDECIHILSNFLSPRRLFLHCCSIPDISALETLKKGMCHAASVSLVRIGAWEGGALPRMMEGLNLMRIPVAEAEIGLVSRDSVTIDNLPLLRFMNRARGTPARILIDELLDRNNIAPDKVPGYASPAARNEGGVITAIKNGSADTGICRKRTAEKADLCWTPLGYESYDLLFPLRAMEETPTIEILTVLKSDQFRTAISHLGGYCTERSGQVIPIFADST